MTVRLNLLFNPFGLTKIKNIMTEVEKLTEEKIFEAATEVFQEKGFDGTRMQNIAQKAGINKALLHYYFRKKDALFDAVFQKLAAKLFSKFAPILEPGLTLEEKLRFFFREHIEFLKENPRLPAFIINEINRKPERIQRIIRNLDFEHFYNVLAEQHRDEFEKYNITPESLPQIMTSIAAISIFPFVARNIFEVILGKFGMDFGKFLEDRKDFAPEFLLGALKYREKSKKIKP